MKTTVSSPKRNRLPKFEWNMEYDLENHERSEVQTKHIPYIPNDEGQPE
ncbi:hypothetical protein PF010_g4069 [Phytophthora fragariae]|uniref:Uncharacterized protein n=1 Tax=Phytophthora fragariae TaxID=53985 RepID=A0A6G0LSB2_9STRA|nr:hypothetical protein PF010_g4075 [Phytophthora fragariae]KAE9129770.1 hypothetical protein PF010_g4069 [Phytophthora fragariae]KAE9243994.1 hypothetical protein PF004_g5871 [Phytophthora fragariae]